jgi:hypothetical protein
MSIYLRELIHELLSENSSVAEDAVVKIGLVLEAKTQGNWDHKTLPFYPHAGLYDELPKSGDVTELIQSIARILVDVSIPFERRQGLIWAAGKSKEKAAFDALLQALRNRDGLSDYVERGVILPVLKNFLIFSEEIVVESGCLPDLIRDLEQLEVLNPRMEVIHSDLLSLARDLEKKWLTLTMRTNAPAAPRRTTVIGISATTRLGKWRAANGVGKKGNGVASKYLTIEALRCAGMFVRYAQRNEAGKGSNCNMVRYLDDVDRHDFLKTLAEACQKTDWQVHAYCLMSNHEIIAARLHLGTSKSANVRLHWPPHG